MWIRVDCAVTRHPKVAKFGKALNMNRHEALGCLVDLWCWAVDYCDDGDLSKYSGDELLVALGIGQQAALIQVDVLDALEQAGLVDRDDDGGVRLHDWHDHQGALVAQREANRERQRRYRDKKKANRDDDVRSPSPNPSPNPATYERRVQDKENDTDGRTKRPADTHDAYKVLEFEELVPITEGECKRWRKLFPDLDLDVELEKMYAYLHSSPPSKRPKASLPRFGLNWLQRCQTALDKEAKVSSRESRKLERRQAEDMAWLEELQRQPGGVSKAVLDQAKAEMHQVFNKRAYRKRKEGAAQ